MELYGALLLFLLGSGTFVIHRLLESNNVGESLRRFIRPDIVRNFLAAGAFLAMWWLHGLYHRSYSPQAQAVQRIDELRMLWQREDKAEVERRLESLAYEMQPWDEGYGQLADQD